jgi:phosphonate transport system substrate-binding protein
MKFVRGILMAVAVVVTASCLPEKEETHPSILRIGILPDQTEDKLRKRYAPLLAHIQSQIGQPVKLIVPKSYGDLLKLFGDGKIDLAYFGGFTYLKAAHKNGAVPVAMRDIDTRFRSYFLVRGDDPARELRDKRGAGLSFGSRLSTSGHLMPRHFLNQSGMPPEQFFREVKYSGAHDKTAYLVRDGKADVGAVNAIIVDQMFRDGRLKRSQVRVLWETPPYPDYVWAIRGAIAEDLRSKVLNSFLSLSLDTPKHGDILRKIGAESFLPARQKDFSQLREIAKALDLLS